MAVSKRLRAEILRRDNSTCQKCGAKAPDVKLVIDHVIPQALGGSDQPSNLQTLCDPCNSGKSATPPDAATVQRVSEDALRWSRAMEAAAAGMLSEHEDRAEARRKFDAKWSSWSEGRPPLPRPAGWESSVDSLLAAGLPLPVLLDCVDIAMNARHVKAANVFKYMCGVAWKKTRELQKAAAEMVHAPTASPAMPDHNEYVSFLYGLTQMEIEVYTAMARSVRAWLGVTVDEEALAGAIAQAEFEEAGRRNDLIKLYLEEYVNDGMRFWRQAYKEWLAEDPTTGPDDDEVWDRAAELATQDEAIGQFAWSYFFGLDPDEKEQWVQYARRVRSHGDTLDGKSLAIEASRIAYDVSEGRPLPQGMCRYRPPSGIRVCFEASAFRVTLADCSTCAGPCNGEHHLCAGHLEALMDDRRPDQHLVITDYTPLKAEET